MRAKTFIDLYDGDKFLKSLEKIETITGDIEWCSEDGSECKDKYTRKIRPVSQEDRLEALERYEEFKKHLTTI